MTSRHVYHNKFCYSYSNCVLLKIKPLSPTIILFSIILFNIILFSIILFTIIQCYYTTTIMNLFKKTYKYSGEASGDEEVKTL